MTLDELCVKISVAADEALATLEGLTQGMQVLGAAFEKQYALKVDTSEAQKELGLANKAVSSFGDALKEQTKYAIEDLQKQKQQAFSFGEVLTGIGSGWKSILSNGMVSLFVETVAWGAQQLMTMEAEAKRAEAERVQANKDAVEAANENGQALDDLAARHQYLSAKAELSYSEQAEMTSMQIQLKNQFDITAGAVDALSNKYVGLGDAIKMAQEIQKEQSAEALSAVAKDSKQAYADELTKTYRDRDNYQESLAQANTNLLTAKFKSSEWYGYKDEVDLYTSEIEKCNQTLANSTTLQAAFNDTLMESAGRAEDGGKAISGELVTALGALVHMDASQQNGIDGGLKLADSIAEQITAIASDPKITEAVGGMKGIAQNVLDGFTPSDGQIETFTEGWAMLTEDGNPLMTLLGMLAEYSDSTTDSAESLLAGMLGLSESFVMVGENGQAFVGSQEDIANALNGTAEGVREAKTAVADISTEYDKLGIEISATDRKIQSAKGVAANIKAWKDAKSAFDKVNKSSKDTTQEIRDMDAAAKKLGKSVDGSTNSVDEADKAFEAYSKGLQAQEAAIVSEIASLESDLASLEASSNIEGSATIDATTAQAEIDRLKKELAVLRAEMAATGITPASTGSGKGGGGGKKDDGARAAEEAARAAEEARKEAIRRDYDYIDHKRHMGEITLEQELSMIERIRHAHQLNAEEIMEWEEKVYDLKKEIRERDADSIDQMADGVVSALENRYEAMRDAELERLDAGREAWENWRDDSVKAIEDQIAALEKLSDAEDREKKDAEELRKIEKLRREIEYEQDDYNRLKLEQQLEAAMESREERLRKLALQDEKDALREEIDRINDKADEQISALDKEQEEIEAAYEERLKQAALNAEAEKLIMTKSQDELMNLLYEYVPEYDALGKTMGEKLLDGFKGKVGGIVEWFKSFNDGLYQMQQELAQASGAAADGFYQRHENVQGGAGAAGVTVNQTVQFYEPVESPSQVARRMEDVNDALGVLLG